MKQRPNITGGLLLMLLILLLLASLLTVFKAPAYPLWLLAIAVSEFPLLFAGITAAFLIAAFWSPRYRPILIIMGLMAVTLYLSPICRAYIIADELEQKADGVFGHPKVQNNQPVFSFTKLFKRVGNDSVKYQTLTYSNTLTLDFYAARLPGKKPCVVVVHGGSWSSGDSRQLPELNSYLAKAGYNVASVNYHLAPKYQAPQAIVDVKAAFAYLRHNAERLNIDTNNFVLLGRSAGAQIALLSAYTQHEPGLKGVIDFYGPADMVWGYSAPASKLVMDSRAVMERYLGGTYKAVPDKYFASSPIEFVNPQTVPTLIIHGDNDVLVSPLHSVKLANKLQQNAVKHFFLELPWATHGFDYNLNGPGGQLSTYMVMRFTGFVTQKLN